MQRVTAPVISEFYTRIHGEEGVNIRCGTGVTGFKGNGRVAMVTCSDGSEYAADLVIIGVGIVPNTELAEAAGLQVDNGIVVNGQAQTSDPDIYAAETVRFITTRSMIVGPARVGAECHGPVQGHRWRRLRQGNGLQQRAVVLVRSIRPHVADRRTITGLR